MKKTHLVIEVAEKMQISYEKASVLVNTVFNTIGRELKKGDSVCITGFGTFKSRKQNACKISFNHKDYIRVPATRVVDFASGERLKKLVRRKVNSLY